MSKEVKHSKTGGSRSKITSPEKRLRVKLCRSLYETALPELPHAAIFELNNSSKNRVICGGVKSGRRIGLAASVMSQESRDTFKAIATLENGKTKDLKAKYAAFIVK